MTWIVRDNESGKPYGNRSPGSGLVTVAEPFAYPFVSQDEAEDTEALALLKNFRIEEVA